MGIAGKAFCNCKNSDGRFLDTGTVAACLLYVRPPQKKQATWEIYNCFLPSSLSSPAVTCNKKKHKQLFLFYFFLLRSVESFSPFVVLSFFRWRTALRSGRLWLVVGGFCVFCRAWAAGSEARLCCTRRRQTTRVDGWIDDFSPPTSFLHRRCRPPPPWLGDRCPFKFWFSPPYLFLVVFRVGFVESREAKLWWGFLGGWVSGKRGRSCSSGAGKWRWGRESLSGSGSWGKRKGNGAGLLAGT